jgi:hypothetical protein
MKGRVGWLERSDRAFNGAGPAFGGTVHGPHCGGTGFLGKCTHCGARIYFWKCHHIRVWLPLEAWVSGRLEEGRWAFHGTYCRHGTAA